MRAWLCFVFVLVGCAAPRPASVEQERVACGASAGLKVETVKTLNVSPSEQSEKKEAAEHGAHHGHHHH